MTEVSIHQASAQRAVIGVGLTQTLVDTCRLKQAMLLILLFKQREICTVEWMGMSRGALANRTRGPTSFITLSVRERRAPTFQDWPGQVVAEDATDIQ